MIIPVKTDQRDYDIVIEKGCLLKAAEEIGKGRKALIVTDDGVPATYAETVLSGCDDGIIFTIPRGEDSKSFDNFRALNSAMLSASFTRRDCVIAVGGGVVGDLAGFAASAYMRGIDFYNIPTTLLSQVDSSVGGKTAVNLDGVKNIVGAFWQPKKVFIDPDTLKTLEPRQLSAGLAEAIKMAANFDTELFEYIESLDNLDEGIENIIAGALKIKRDVVQQDPTEKGLRKVLNFGHTVGHGIESAGRGKYLHGECVAMGMLPFSGENVRKRLIGCLKKYNLPTEIEYTPDEIIDIIMHDKKRQKSSITCVICDEIGTFRFEDMTKEQIVARINLVR